MSGRRSSLTPEQSRAQAVRNFAAIRYTGADHAIADRGQPGSPNLTDAEIASVWPDRARELGIGQDDTETQVAP